MLDKCPGRSKLKAKSTECIMVGYSSESKAYRVYEPKSKKICTTRDVKFIEDVGKHSSKNSIDVYFLETNQASQTQNEEPTIKNNITYVSEELNKDDVTSYDDAVPAAANDDAVPAAVDDDDVAAAVNDGEVGDDHDTSSL